MHRKLAVLSLIIVSMVAAKVIVTQSDVPDGYSATVITRSGEKIYFKTVHLDVLDVKSLDPKSEVFYLHTDAGWLQLPKGLNGVRLLEVIQLPAFLDDPDSLTRFSKAEIKSISEGKAHLTCVIRITFHTDKVLTGGVAVNPRRWQNIVRGQTPEGPREMTISDIVSIQIKSKESSQD